MTTRRERLIAKMVWWASGAPDVLIAAALVMVQEPSFARPDMLWAERWKRLSRLLRAKLALTRGLLKRAMNDRDDEKKSAEYWREKYDRIVIELDKKKAFDNENPSD